VLNWYTLGLASKLDLSPMDGFLKGSGFKDGLALSYAPITQLAPGGFIIPAGLSFTGKLTIMNSYTAFLKLEISPASGIFLAVAEADPITLGGVVKLQRSKKNASDGPKFIIDIDPLKGKLLVDIEGYVYLFGFGVYLRINISKSGLEFVTEVPFGIPLLTARVHVKAVLPFGKENALSDTSCTFVASLLPGPLMKALKKIANRIKTKLSGKQQEMHMKLQQGQYASLADDFDEFLGENDCRGCAKHFREALLDDSQRLGDGMHSQWSMKKKLQAAREKSQKRDAKRKKKFNRARKKSKKRMRRLKSKAGRHANFHEKRAKKNIECGGCLTKEDGDNVKKAGEQGLQGLKGLKEMAQALVEDPTSVISFCGAKVEGGIGAELPPFIKGEVEVLLMGHSTHMKVELNTGEVKKSIASLVTALWPIVKTMLKSGHGRGDDKCQIVIPEVTKPSRKKVGIKKMLPSPGDILKSQPHPANLPNETLSEEDPEKDMEMVVAEQKDSGSNAVFPGQTSENQQISIKKEKLIYQLGYKAGYLRTDDPAKIQAETKIEHGVDADTVREVFNAGYAMGYNESVTRIGDSALLDNAPVHVA